MKIKAIPLNNGQYVYMQVDDSLTLDAPQIRQAISQASNDSGFERKGDPSDAAHKVVNNLSGLIKAVADTSLNALQESIGAHVDKVTLEFGITLGGEAGVPFVTSGKAEGAIKVAVECHFRDK